MPGVSLGRHGRSSPAAGFRAPRHAQVHDQGEAVPAPSSPAPAAKDWLGVERVTCAEELSEELAPSAPEQDVAAEEAVTLPAHYDAGSYCRSLPFYCPLS